MSAIQRLPPAAGRAAPVAASRRPYRNLSRSAARSATFCPYFGRRSCRVSISVSDVRLTEPTVRHRVDVSSINPAARGETRAQWS